MPKLVRGSDLLPGTRDEVLRTFCHRWTVENAQQTYGGECPACIQQAQTGGKLIMPGGKKWHEYHAPLTTDEEWLKRYGFYVNSDGKLTARRRYAIPMLDAA